MKIFASYFTVLTEVDVYVSLFIAELSKSYYIMFTQYKNM